MIQISFAFFKIHGSLFNVFLKISPNTTIFVDNLASMR